jgi:hypothetical protein
MEETGILENTALLNLVLPDFEPGPNRTLDSDKTPGATDRYGMTPE